jgi:hypothetical protein
MYSWLLVNWVQLLLLLLDSHTNNVALNNSPSLLSQSHRSSFPFPPLRLLHPHEPLACQLGESRSPNMRLDVKARYPLSIICQNAG